MSISTVHADKTDGPFPLNYTMIKNLITHSQRPLELYIFLSIFGSCTMLFVLSNGFQWFHWFRATFWRSLASVQKPSPRLIVVIVIGFVRIVVMAISIVVGTVIVVIVIHLISLAAPTMAHGETVVGMQAISISR